MRPRRPRPDPVLLGFLSSGDPPVDPSVRADVVRLALAWFARGRGYDRLGAALLSSGDGELASLLLALTGAWETWDLDDARDRRVVRLVATIAPSEWFARRPWHSTCPLDDATFVRLAEIASDVLTWETDPELARVELVTYVRPAWLVLADELEYEREEAEDMLWLPPPPKRLDRRGARRLAETDRRRDARGSW